MQPLSPVERTLTQLDHVRLRRLLDDTAAAHAELPLADLLASSDLVTSTAVPPDTVTMNSRVLLADVDAAGGAPYKLTLCYPKDARPAEGFVSVLSPVGTALLGLRTGDTARWPTPLGGESRATIRAVLFQPEASGDYLR